MTNTNRFARIAEGSAKKVEEELLKVSFEYLDWSSEYFFVHGVEDKYYQKFFQCITALQLSRNDDIAKQNHPSLAPKSIFNTDNSLYPSFPEVVINKVRDKLFIETRDTELALSNALEITRRAFEISLGKNYGRLHGFLWNNTFHIVWTDPAHNLYPGKGTPKRGNEYAAVKCFSPVEMMRLREELAKVEEELADLYRVWASS